MSNVYKVGEDRRLIIYSIARFIYLRTAYKDGLERPIVLADDYLDGLSEVVHEGTIYYAYQNQNRDVCVRNIMSQNTLLRIDSGTRPDMLNPLLCEAYGELYLFYMIRNPLSDTESLKCVKPLKEGDEVELPEQLNSIDMFQISRIQEKNILFADEFYEIGEGATFTMLSRGGVEVRKASVDERDTIVDSYKQRLWEKDQVIESIKSQYNELMEIANEYRSEALKWRKKFM